MHSDKSTPSGDSPTTTRMRRSPRRSIVIVALLAASAVVGTSTLVGAASWTKNSFVASSCSGYYPVAGRFYVVNVQGGGTLRCYQNSTSTLSDGALSNDTFSNGVALAPPAAITRWGISVSPTETVTIYGGNSCTGGSQLISAGGNFLSTGTWNSYKRLSASSC